ncbi:protein kinase domain-containing protein [Helicovermis profundi]|uniref:Protein kinase domain-containing protein n=1 Tax=Helicovermis profundi TaxID=3065157 RepID=A0AAU9E7W2_9FIRM|nr:hypothetical protein HLPR_10930 [Clostridia bacterium S502]
MSRKISLGSLVKSNTGKRYYLKEMLGFGGQGEVFRVTFENKEYALKWYYPNIATEKQFNLIKKLISIGPPNDNFLWPTEIVVDSRFHGFGYIMKIRENRFKGIVGLMKRKIEPSFYTLILSAITMVDSFEKLHKKDLCYRDISFGNLFIDEKTGEILICDNDNITHEKHADRSILGTPRFMAPEIVRGDSLPNVESDLFSLAILLFYMLIVHHPLEGKVESTIKCFDLPAMNKLYGTNPVFIFDPMNYSNRPVKGMHDNALVFWNIYPTYIKESFTKIFTKGLKPNSGFRITEREWKNVLIRLKSSIYKCSCGAENFYNALDFEKGNNNHCWNCNSKLKIPPRIKINDNIVVLSENTKIYKHTLYKDGKIDYKKIVAKVVANPDDKRKLGIRNLSKQEWLVKTIDDKILSIDDGWSINIETVSEVKFTEGIVGKIRI